jgi:solute carrier family 10 (sodium/bile acid cotransporter), member 7
MMSLYYNASLYKFAFTVLVCLVCTTTTTTTTHERSWLLCGQRIHPSAYTTVNAIHLSSFVPTTATSRSFLNTASIDRKHFPKERRWTSIPLSLPSSEHIPTITSKFDRIDLPNQQRIKLQKWIQRNFFVLGMIATVLFAYRFPQLGTTGGIIHPELWLNQYGVSYVFLLSGLSIQLEQMKQAAYNMKLNTLIQSILFFVWPFGIGVPIRYFFTTILSQTVSLSKPVLDGIVVLSCLPTTVNMCVILTSTVGGNVASALCNAVLSNILGIVITPMLLFRFFGSDITLPFYTMVKKLMTKVLLPVVIGQLLRAKVPAIQSWYYRHEKLLKRSQEIILLGILWNAFCTAITSNLGMGFKDGVALLTLLPILHVLALAGTFTFFSLPLLKLTRVEVIAAMFCASQKTLAFGLPIIQTIFEGNANLALYSAPLMLLHPLQLMIGSLIAPRLEQYIKADINHTS